MNKRSRCFVVVVTTASVVAITNRQYVYAAQDPISILSDGSMASDSTENGVLELNNGNNITTGPAYNITTGPAYNITTGPSYIFLSDLEAVPSMTEVGYGSLMIDKNTDGKPIKLQLNGRTPTFTKGIGAHAISKVTYDLTSYGNYTTFVTYAGVDASRGSAGNGVVITAQVSNDGVSWEDKATSSIQKGDTEAYYIDIDITGYKYLRLYAHHNGNNAADHVVYGHPRILKDGYDIKNEGLLLGKTLAEYDAELKGYGLDTPVSTYENVLYQRTLISELGEDQLKLESIVNPEIGDVVRWLLNDSKALYYYTTGGNHETSALTALNVLGELYKNLKDDFSDAGDGDFYKKLAITMALTNSKGTTAVERYRTYKDLYNKGRLFNKEQFRSLPVETLRLAVNGGIDNIQIPWLNAKVRGYDPDGTIGSMDPYYHMKYRKGYNYKDPKYFSSENFAMWNEKYKLSQYNIPYGDLSYSAFWIMFEEGAVCGGISEAGTALHTAFGIPVVFVAQPGHAAYLTYSQNKNGEGIWSIGNNISGFKQTRKGGRLPLGWGSDSWNTNYTGSYYLLSQHALNNYSDYIEALDRVLLADVYNDDNNTKQKVYKKALEAQPYNLDAMEGLIKTYQADSTKDSGAYNDLAMEFGKNLKYFPLAMSDMLSFINKNITDGATKYNVDMLKYKYLEEALLADASTSLQPSDCRDIANFILGNNEFQVATFSFDGENAGQIVMGKQYENSTFMLKYSIDGGTTWEETTDKIVQLSPDQVNRITPENDIKLMLVGSEFKYTMDIVEGTTPKNKKIYQNDLENKLFGDTEILEYSLDDGTTWLDYVSGVDGTRFSSSDEKVLVRCKATGVSTLSEPSLYEFKADGDSLENQYISLDRLSVSDFSSQGGNDTLVATNVLDGNIYSMWKTATAAETAEGRYITIEIDKPTYISQIEYIPIENAGDGTITKANIYVSLDNVKWNKVASDISWERNSQTKTYQFSDPIYGKYIKIEGVEAQNNYCSASVINLFEDKTQNRNIWFNLQHGKELRLYKGEPYDLEDNIIDNYGSVYNTPIRPRDFDIRVEKLDEFGNVVAVGKGLGRKGNGDLLKSGPYRVTYSLTINGETVSKSTIAKVLDIAKPADYTTITLGNKVTIDNSTRGIGLWDGTKEEYFQKAIVIVDAGDFTIDISNKEYGFITLAYGIKDSVRQNVNWGKNGIIQLKVLADDKLIYQSGKLGWKDKYIEPVIEIPYGTKKLKIVNVAVGAGNNHAAVANIRFHDYQYGINWTDDELVDELVVPVKNIALNFSDLKLKLDNQETLVASITPSDATIKNVIWETDDAEVATVTFDGLVFAKGVGIANITCRSTDNTDIVATCKVTVTGNDINPDPDPDDNEDGGNSNPPDNNGGGDTPNPPDNSGGGDTPNPPDNNGGGGNPAPNPDPAPDNSISNQGKEDKVENTTESTTANGVDRWLITDGTVAYLKNTVGNEFKPSELITRAEVCEMIFQVLKDPGTNTVNYTDVSKDKPYAHAVGILASKGILRGYGNGIFKPDNLITRAEFIAIVTRFANEAEAAKTFKDVPTSHWAYQAISTAATYGWVGGYEDGEFRPDDLITRAEGVAIINRIVGISQEVGVPNKEFIDVLTSHWAYNDIMLAVFGVNIK